MSKEYQVGVNRVVLYTIGELAKACGRATITVRKWEQEGVIPSTLIRDESNRRLYTKEQVEGITILVRKYVVRGVRIPQAFHDGVSKLFKGV